MLQRLRPALLGIADRNRDGIAAEIEIRVFETLLHRARGICLVQNLHVGADLRQLVRVLAQNAHAHAAAHHEKIEQIVVSVEIVDYLKRTVVIRHRVRVRYGRIAHPERSPGQELTEMINVVVQPLGLLARRRSQRAVVFHRAAHRLPPELTAAILRQITRIGAGIDKRAELFHRVRRVLVGAEELTREKALAPILTGALLFLLNTIEDVRLRRAEALLFKQAFLHGVLDRLNLHDVLRHGAQLFLNGLCGALDSFVAVFARRSRRQADRTADKLPLEGNDGTVSLFYIHSFFPPLPFLFYL